MFYEVLNEKQLKVLEKIVFQMPVQGSYLAGGTALALQLGHRKSEDLDWFSPVEFSVDELSSKLKKIGNFQVLDLSKGTLHGIVDGVRITWLYFPNPLLKELVIDKDVNNLPLASLEDIGLMKIIAVSQRGAKKDFIDLFALTQNGIEVGELLKSLHLKYPGEKLNYYHIVKSLCYFDDAEEELMPEMLWNYNWDEIKKYFLGKQKEFINVLKNLIVKEGIEY
ncbi:hypothetical protein ciss_12880 [Carboxydothermus islandicus]|uniref:Nucleotidyltransferase n=1 Tax=Carboxydothermus islandicus TaxID=661089 RepID=A0A1L8D2D5_9THEO|nr:nucleotidyl transferase AbiEii/AbiGii toxin family protein [Carboxydothermus islandicus]GAV25355.1 hypothetical protein ciss_12880 [Carboxydothermus islandicus]